MRRSAGLLSWRRPATNSTALLAVVVLLALLALLGNSRPILADELSQESETKIEITLTGGLSAVQSAKIDELMEVLESQSPRLKIKTQNQEKGEKGGKGEKEKDGKESKAEKYLFFPLTVVMFGAVASLTVAAQRWRRARAGINPLGNLATAVAFALVAASGLLLIFEIKLKDQGVDVKFWHVVTGIVFVYLILFHVVNNWRAWLAYIRRATRWVRSATA